MMFHKKISSVVIIICSSFHFDLLNRISGLKGISIYSLLLMSISENEYSPIGQFEEKSTGDRG